MQRILGDEFRVHFMKDVYFGSHIDSTLVALRPGLVLANPERLSMDTIPEFLKDWEIIFSPPMENQERHSPEYLQQAIGSEWIDMNFFSLGSDTVVVDSYQTGLISLLESKGLEVIPLTLRHSRMMGGGATASRWIPGAVARWNPTFPDGPTMTDCGCPMTLLWIALLPAAVTAAWVRYRQVVADNAYSPSQDPRCLNPIHRHRGAFIATSKGARRLHEIFRAPAAQISHTDCAVGSRDRGVTDLRRRSINWPINSRP